MGALKCVTVLVLIVFMCNLVPAKEFVPVYMWSTQRINEKVPALHRIGEDSFKDDLMERLKDKPAVVFFLEPTLSPEDFTLRDRSGEPVFKNLAKLKASTKTSYLPSVQNPLKALKQLPIPVEEVAAQDINDQFKFPDSKVLLINMNDAKDDENRVDMLKRHDETINSVFNHYLGKHENVLAVYTAKHTSWVGSEDVLHNRRTRQLLQDLSNESAAPSNFYMAQNAIVYFTNASFKADQPTNLTSIKVSTDLNNGTVIVDLTDASVAVTVKLSFTLYTTGINAGYYSLNVPIEASIGGKAYALNTQSEIYAPANFSYHCGDQNFTDDKTAWVFFKNFQIQAFFEANHTNTNATIFNDAYDCVGFTSIPIWSGLFVTIILLIIVSLGITMMMDIRTMDRFDDAKGKTITINASE